MFNEDEVYNKEKQINRNCSNVHRVANVKERIRLLKEVRELQTKKKEVVEIKREDEKLIEESRFNSNETFNFLKTIIPNFGMDDLLNINIISLIYLEESKNIVNLISINDLFLKLFHEIVYCKNNDNPHRLILSQKIIELIAQILAKLFTKNKIKIKSMNMFEFLNYIDDEEIDELCSDTAKKDILIEHSIVKSSSVAKILNISNIFNFSRCNFNTSTYEIINLTMIQQQNISQSQQHTIEDLIKIPKKAILTNNLANFTLVRKKNKNKIFFFNLREIFENIKSIVFLFPEETVSINSYILVMLNIKWMFKNILEVEVNFEPKEKKIFDFYYNSNMQMAKTFYILSYYIPVQFKYVQSLKINLPYSFNKELHYYLNYNTKILHFVELFERYTNLNKIEINFNAIDQFIYSKILQIIYKNKNVRSLCLNIFPTSIQLYSNIYLKNYSINDFKNNLKEVNRFKESFMNSNIEVDINLLLNKLFDKFELNFELLFSIVSIRLNKLNIFNLKIDVPEILNNIDKYISVIHKFLFDFFSYVEQGSNSFQTIEIDSVNLIIDKRKYPYLYSLIDNLNLNLSNRKNLINFNLIFKFNKVLEIYKFLPLLSLEYVKLGNLDIESFKNFNNFFIKEKIIPNLKSLHLIISCSNPNPFDNQFEIKRFITCKKSKQLNEIVLHTKLFLNHYAVIEMINSIPDDGVKSFEFSFCESMIIDKDLLELDFDDNYFEYDINSNELSKYSTQLIDYHKIKKFYYQIHPKYLKIVYLCHIIFHKKRAITSYKNILSTILDFLKIKIQKKLKVIFDT